MMVFLTFVIAAATVAICLYTREKADQQRQTSIRPLVVASRFSEKGDVGVFPGDGGKNDEIAVFNFGNGLAHRVNARLEPPARADIGNPREEKEEVPVLHQLELPVKGKRMWDRGGFCGENNWHYLYAEYEDLEGRAYYTLQSGYSVKTGPLSELHRKRIPDDDKFWDNKLVDWRQELPLSLRMWAEEQRRIYKNRRPVKKGK